jgi:hypothetical protein
MKTSGLATRLLTFAVGVILVSVPLYAFLTVWGSSLVGHYTALRLYAEMLLILASLLALYIVVVHETIRRDLFKSKLIWLITGYVVLSVIVGAVAYYTKNVTAKALGYGLIVDTRFVVFFLVSWVAALSSGLLRKLWIPILLWPAAIVTAFGLLQAFILPHDFLKHFGYGPSTIQPYQTINDNQKYTRIQSTLRGVNPFGAYLVVITSSIAGLWLRMKRNWQEITLFLASLIALFYTFSRSAWIGAFVAVAFIASVGLYKTKFFSIVVVTAATIVLIVAVLVVVDRHSTRLQNLIFHTQTNSASKTTSDQGHLSGLKSGLKDIYHQPFGGGVGTAGPASVYNPKRVRIAEDYYIQIGQETGVVGLGLFVAINICVGYRLWQRRSDALAVGLFASFLGLVIVNLFSHAWADPTLAYLWWGFAGIAMTIKLPKNKKLQT